MAKSEKNVETDIKVTPVEVTPDTKGKPQKYRIVRGKRYPLK